MFICQRDWHQLAKAKVIIIMHQLSICYFKFNFKPKISGSYADDDFSMRSSTACWYTSYKCTYVHKYVECECTGEVWENDLMRIMREFVCLHCNRLNDTYWINYIYKLAVAYNECWMYVKITQLIPPPAETIRTYVCTHRICRRYTLNLNLINK